MINPNKTPMLIKKGNKLIQFTCKNCGSPIEYQLCPNGKIITHYITTFEEMITNYITSFGKKRSIITCWQCDAKYELQNETFDEFVKRRNKGFFDFLFRRDKEVEEYYKK